MESSMPFTEAQIRLVEGYAFHFPFLTTTDILTHAETMMVKIARTTDTMQALLLLGFTGAENPKMLTRAEVSAAFIEAINAERTEWQRCNELLSQVSAANIAHPCQETATILHIIVSQMHYIQYVYEHQLVVARDVLEARLPKLAKAS